MKKTRNLSVAEYYSVIQREYLIAEFRKKIYYNPKDKSYYQRVMSHKEGKIRDISERNHLDSIFTNPRLMLEVRKELFDQNGRPTFEMTPTDIQNYYCVGNEFAYKGEIWILDCVNSDDTLIIYSPEYKRSEVVKKDDVCRIL